jgi:hypothetical protein
LKKGAKKRKKKKKKKKIKKKTALVQGNVTVGVTESKRWILLEALKQSDFSFYRPIECHGGKKGRR